MMIRLKDARRIAPYSVLSQFCPIFAYREACAPLLCSYRGGSLSHASTPEQAHRGCRLMTLALIYDDKVKRCQTTNCSVQRTLAILPNIRISRSLRSAFMLISGRVIKPCIHSGASSSWLQAYDPGILNSEETLKIF